jgi:ABC-2 type transport system permease protein
MRKMEKYKTCFLMGVQKAIEYRFDFFLSFFSTVFPIIIQVSMWTAIYKATGNGMLYGYTYVQMILYTFFVGIVGKFLSNGFEYEMNDDIKNGGLNKFIVKPINYCFYRASCFLGERTSVSIIFMFVLLILSIVFFTLGYFKLTGIRVVFFFISLFMALILNFAIYFCVGMAGLWMSEISRLFPAISIILSVMSGGIFPLDILGERINQIILFLPFKYMLQFPVDIITGKTFENTLILAFVIQLGWVIYFIWMANLLWKKGIKKYIAIGG